MIAIPEYFADVMIGMYGEEGRAWLDRLPEILDACARQWGLTLGMPFAQLTYNYVTAAVRADGTPVVVKACPPRGEFLEQEAALRLYDGRGAVRQLAADHERRVLLLERLEPGTLLSSLEDDEEACAIAAEVMRALWRPVPANHPFPTTADWGSGFARLRRHYSGGSGPFPPALLAKAERLFRDLDQSAATPVVLHGDLHHYNIMAAGPRGWLAIDPKGLVGEPAYEIGAFLRNRLPEPLPNPEAARITARRVDQFAKALGLDRARVRDWGLAQAILSAWWSIEDHGHGWEPMVGLADIMATI